MGRYIVIKDLLNVRNRPSLGDETFVGTLKLGEAVDLLDQPIAGETPAGTTDNFWHADNLNRFLARAGVAKEGTYEAKKAEFLADDFNKSFFDENDKENEEKWKVSWGHVDMEIWKIWKDYKTRGSGVRVAIIDTGVIFSNNDLKNRISNLSISIVGGSIDDNSKLHHGTMSAGLIGANGNNVGTVYGIAPECELIVIKAGVNTFVPFNILSALKKAIDLKSDVISISIEVYKSTFQQDPNTFTQLEKLIRDNKESGIIIVAAVGDQEDTSVSYPASFDGCFSVGAYSLDAGKQRIINTLNNRNQFLKFLCPGDHIRTCAIDSAPAFYDASSAATAFAAGVFALVISSVKKAGLNFSTINSAIETGDFTEPILQEPLPSDEQGYGIFSPYDFINSLNT